MKIKISFIFYWEGYILFVAVEGLGQKYIKIYIYMICICGCRKYMMFVVATNNIESHPPPYINWNN